jgi:membrane protease YdiL (CAAX protease family)
LKELEKVKAALPMNDAEIAQPLCPHCGTIVQQGDNFCGACGKDIKANLTTSADHHQDVFEILKPTLAYYGITLLLLATYKLTSLFPDGFEGMLGITIIDTTIVVAFWMLFSRELRPLFSFRNVKLKTIALTVMCAAVGAVVVSFAAEIINFSISDDVFYDMYLFEDTNYPFLFATLFIAVHPAIFEEVAFRGFMYNNVAELTTPWNAIFITGFVFGIIHLAIISMLWLVPIGLIFAWLRWKYNTLWYGMVGHFVYNFSITVIEYYGWLN